MQVYLRIATAFGGKAGLEVDFGFSLRILFICHFYFFSFCLLSNLGQVTEDSAVWGFYFF